MSVDVCLCVCRGPMEACSSWKRSSPKLWGRWWPFTCITRRASQHSSLQWPSTSSADKPPSEVIWHHLRHWALRSGFFLLSFFLSFFFCLLRYTHIVQNIPEFFSSSDIWIVQVSAVWKISILFDGIHPSCVQNAKKATSLYTEYFINETFRDTFLNRTKMPWKWHKSHWYLDLEHIFVKWELDIHFTSSLIHTPWSKRNVYCFLDL